MENHNLMEGGFEMTTMVTENETADGDAVVLAGFDRTDTSDAELNDLEKKKARLRHELLEKKREDKRRLLLKEIDTLKSELSKKPVESDSPEIDIPPEGDEKVRNFYRNHGNARTTPNVAKSVYKKYGNGYATKKTVSQGLLDFGLLTANVAQLDMMIKFGPDKLNNFWPGLVLVIIAIILEAALAFIVVYLSFIHAKTSAEKRKAKRLNNVCLYVVSAITVVNVFKTGFAIKGTES